MRLRSANKRFFVQPGPPDAGAPFSMGDRYERAAAVVKREASTEGQALCGVERARVAVRPQMCCAVGEQPWVSVPLEVVVKLQRR